MGRYSGTLHKLCDAGPNKRGNWNLVMNYLEGNSIQDAPGGSNANPNFDSPLKPYTVPSELLEAELLDGQGPKNEDTPLRIICRQTTGSGSSSSSSSSSNQVPCPWQVLAAMCHLAPEAARLADHRDRLPLHWACRSRATPLVTPETKGGDLHAEKCLKILVSVYPRALVHRDDAGRTPLHYLVWYHAPTRSPKLVEHFLQTLPDAAFVGLRQMPTTNNNNNTNNGKDSSSSSSNYHKSNALASPSAFAPRNSPSRKTQSASVGGLPPLPEIPVPTTLHQKQMKKATKAKQKQLMAAAAAAVASAAGADEHENSMNGMTFPSSAAIVPDARHGCLPLHYAVMEGASKEVIRMLLMHYPQSKVMVDRWGRTALHWYLGAGMVGTGALPEHVSGEQPDPNAIPWHEMHLSSNVVHLLLNSTVARARDVRMARLPLHWACCLLAKYHYSPQRFQELVSNGNKDGSGGDKSTYPLRGSPRANSSKRDLMRDAQNEGKRSSCISVKALQLLLDNFMEALVQGDGAGRTPLMLLFSIVSEMQQTEWDRLERNRLSRQSIRTASLWHPPSDLMELLLRSPESYKNDAQRFVPRHTNNPERRPLNAAMVEDQEGRLVLHLALYTATHHSALQPIIQAHPTALVHTTDEEQQTPMHFAFRSPFATPLQRVDTIQLLLQAYVTSRHGTFVDGKLALKMEDTNGMYPLHYACWNGASFAVTKLILDKYPRAACFASGSGDLPLHNLLGKSAADLFELNVDSARGVEDGVNMLLAASMGWTTEPATVYQKQQILALQEKMSLLLDIMIRDPSTLAIGSSRVPGLLPLHMAIMFDAVDYKMLYRLLKAYPESAVQCTNAASTIQQQSHSRSFAAFSDDEMDDMVNRDKYQASHEQQQQRHQYSPLDLHDMRKMVSGSEEANHKWLHVRELLFAFGPTLSSHRTLDDMLEQCTKLIREEATDYMTKLQSSTDFGVQEPTKKTKKNGEDGGGGGDDDDEDESSKLLPTSCFHAQQIWEILNEAPVPPLDTGDASSDVIEAPKIERATKPARLVPTRTPRQNKSQKAQSFGRTPKRNNTKKKRTNTFDSDDEDDDDDEYLDDDTFASKTSFASRVDEYGNKKSIYDEDANDFGYTLSPENSSYDSDEEDEFSQRTKDDIEYLSTEEEDDDTGTSGSYTGDEGNSADDEERTYNPSPTTDIDVDGEGIETIFEEDNQDVGEGLGMNNTNTTGSMTTPTGSENTSAVQPKPPAMRPFLSEVALRLWTFFVLYNDMNDPSDNYAREVDAVLSDLDFDTAAKLVSLPLPPFSTVYVGVVQTDSCLRNEANNFCKTVIHRIFFFLGRYEFKPSPSEGLLLHKSNDGDTVLVRALEYLVRAEAIEYESRAKPGDAEATIWETGDMPAQEPKFTGSDFSVETRKVCFKFMKSQQAYDREVRWRQALGVAVEWAAEDENSPSQVPVVPLIQHYNAVDVENRLYNRRFKRDSHDERFKVLNLGATDLAPSAAEEETLELAQYPYAIVVPFREGGTLFDRFLHHGQMGVEEIREIGSTLGRAIEMFHKKGFVHGNLRMNNIAYVPPSKENDEPHGAWMLTDLSSTCEQGSSTIRVAGIAVNGSANFSTSTFPPELFTKVNPGELKMYNDYWEAARLHGIKLDPDVVAPKTDPLTGETYVLKCYYTGEAAKLPALPYRLVPARETLDLWAYGQLMYLLCSSGHPLFPANVKTGHLLSFGETAQWDIERARSKIYRHIEDPLAQDLLFHLLTDFESRSSLQMETVLSHPFFSRDIDPSMDSIAQKIMTKRSADCLVYRRGQETKELQQNEGEWVTTKSKSFSCWDLDFQMRMFLSPSNLIKMESTGPTPEIPIAIMLLPYKLSRNKMGKLTPATKKDVERAEKMGIALLRLSKVVYYATLMEEVVEGTENESHAWSNSEISAAMALSAEHFQDLEKEMGLLAAHEVEKFRERPLSVARRLVQERIKELKALYEPDRAAYLYLVDEFVGVPVLDTNTPYPFEVKTRIEHVLFQVLPFMYLSVMYTCGVLGSAEGVVKMIFEAAYPHIPPSWTHAAEGIKYELDEKSLRSELNTLRLAIGELSQLEGSTNANIPSILDNLRFLQSYLHEYDPIHTFSKLERVTSSNSDASFLWTTRTGLEQIKAIASTSSIPKAHRDYKIQKDKLKSQSARIKELESELERLRFQQEHHLDYAMETSSTARNTEEEV